MPGAGDTGTIGSGLSVNVPAQSNAQIIDLTLNGLLTVAAKGTFTASGTVSGPGGLDVFGTAEANTLSSTGAVTVESGGLATIDSTASLTGVNGIFGRLEASGNANVTLGGTTAIGPGDLNGNLAGQAGSSFNLIGSGDTFLSGATLGAGTYNVNVNGTVTVNGDLIDPTIININSDGSTTAGFLTGAGSLDVTNGLNWNGGTIDLAGGTTIESSGDLTTAGPDGKFLTTTLTNESVFCTLGGTGTLTLMPSSSSSTIGTLLNPVGTIHLSLPTIATMAFPPSSTGGITNGGDGTLTEDGTTTISTPFTNDGRVNVSSGAALTLSNPDSTADALDGGSYQLGGDLTLLGSFAATDGVAINSGSGHFILGDGDATPGVLDLTSGNDSVLFGDLEVSNTGTLKGGTLDNNGDLILDETAATALGAYTQSTDGTLDIHAGMLAGPSVTSPTLTVAGTASLSGVLKLDLDGGYVPTSGDTFTVLTTGTITNHFDTTPDGMTINYAGGAVTLTQN